MRGIAVAIMAFALAAAAVTQPAAASSYKTEFSITAYGLRLASTRFETTIKDGRYEMSGTLRARGLARLLGTTGGSLEASGAIANGGIDSSRLNVQFVDDGKTHRIAIQADRNRITDYTNDPEPQRRKDWIAVTADQLAGALDPVAAVLVPARSFREVCNRTIRIFDGAMRSNLELSYLRTIPFKAKGYRGDAVTCRARFVPVSGYRESKRDLTEFRDHGRIELSFAPVGQTGLFAPVRVRVKAKGVEVYVTATRFEQRDD